MTWIFELLVDLEDHTDILPVPDQEGASRPAVSPTPNTGPTVVSTIRGAAEALIRENTVWLPEWLLAAFRQPV